MSQEPSDDTPAILPEAEPDAVPPQACRPVDHVRDPATEPILLPCERTFEPCDGADNDQDGITDPHCPTVPCRDHGTCTLGGLIPDADCNIFEAGRPGCNQIDGMPMTTKTQACQGALCPPGLKCVGGDCVGAGDLLPGATCTSGAQCPMNSGCIPRSYGETATAVCQRFCHDVPCPSGYDCVINRNEPLPGWVVEDHICERVLSSDCTGTEAMSACSGLTGACMTEPACAARLGCMMGCRNAPRSGCSTECEGLPTSEADGPLQKCLAAACAPA